MLVDVVRLRCEGVRLVRARVLAERPVRGELELSGPRYRRRDGNRAWLTVPGRPDAEMLPALDEARVTRLRGDAFLVVGIERIEKYGRMWEDFPQIWWCRLAGGRPAPRAAAPRLQTA